MTKAVNSMSELCSHCGQPATTECGKCGLGVWSSRSKLCERCKELCRVAREEIGLITPPKETGSRFGPLFYSFCLASAKDGDTYVIRKESRSLKKDNSGDSNV